ncbi:hypothetical protein ABK040_001190 [Willaertia magna]
MSISFSSDPIEQQEHVEGLLNEGLFECLLFSLGCDNYQIKTFENIENEIMKKELKKMKFIPLQNYPSFISYKFETQTKQINNNNLLKFEKKHILEDCWKLIIHYIPIQDFNSFLKVCKFFYSILTETIYFKNMKNVVNTTQKFDNINLFFNKNKYTYYLNILNDKDELITKYEKFFVDKSETSLSQFLKNRELTHLEYNLLKFLISKGLISYLKCLPNHWFTNNNNELYLYCLQYPIQYAFDFIPNELQNDRNICLQFITKNHPYLFTKLSKELLEDDEIILTCLDNLINLNQTITSPNEIRTTNPEILMKLFTVEKLSTNLSNNLQPSDLYLEYKGKPLYYKLIEIDANKFNRNYLHYKNNEILNDKEIYKYFVKSNYLQIFYSMPKHLILDFELAKELISLNNQVICLYLNNNKGVKDKYYLESLLNLLPDVTDFERSFADPYNIRNINVDIDLLIRKLGVSKYLLDQKHNSIINIFSNYSTRLFNFIDFKSITLNSDKFYSRSYKKKLMIQKVYIDNQRTLLKNKLSEENKTIYVEPLSTKEVESLLFCNNDNLVMELIKKVPELCLYCIPIYQERVLEHIFYLLNTKQKILLIKNCKNFILKNNLSFKFLENCLFIAPHLLNYETQDFFIDKFIPLLIKYILNNGFTTELKEMIQQIILPEDWRKDKDFLEQALYQCENYNEDIKYAIVLTLKVKNKTVATQLLKENIEYWNLFGNRIKLDRSLLYNLLISKLNNYDREDSFIEKLILPLLLKKKKLTSKYVLNKYMDVFKLVIELDPKLINLFPKELQLHNDILRIIFDKDILNCVTYLPIKILDLFKFFVFDSVDFSKRKLILQQFKERYNKELSK